jgi:hypothetical protein
MAENGILAVDDDAHVAPEIAHNAADRIEGALWNEV